MLEKAKGRSTRPIHRQSPFTGPERPRRQLAIQSPKQRQCRQRFGRKRAAQCPPTASVRRFFIDNPARKILIRGNVSRIRKGTPKSVAQRRLADIEWLTYAGSIADVPRITIDDPMPQGLRTGAADSSLQRTRKLDRFGADHNESASHHFGHRCILKRSDDLHRTLPFARAENHRPNGFALDESVNQIASETST